MTATRRAQSRTTHNAIDALNGLPKRIAIYLERHVDGQWSCELSTRRRDLAYAQKGRTPCEAAAAVLTQYNGEAERNRINQAITQTSGDKTAAAALLGMSRKTLYRRLETLAQI